MERFGERWISSRVLLRAQVGGAQDHRTRQVVLYGKVPGLRVAHTVTAAATAKVFKIEASGEADEPIREREQVVDARHQSRRDSRTEAAAPAAWPVWFVNPIRCSTRRSRRGRTVERFATRFPGQSEARREVVLVGFDQRLGETFR